MEHKRVEVDQVKLQVRCLQCGYLGIVGDQGELNAMLGEAHLAHGFALSWDRGEKWVKDNGSQT